MPDRKVILYIAMSLDGYIAKDDDDISFLSTVDKPGEDYGFHQFIQTIDTIIWGRKTYDKLLSFDMEFPYPDKKCYVFSNSRTGYDENVEFFNGNIKDLIDELRQKPGKHIYCDGGSQLVSELLNDRLIDEFIISIIPHLVGKGVRLFQNGLPEQSLELVKSTLFPTGLVQNWYQKKVP